MEVTMTSKEEFAQDSKKNKESRMRILGLKNKILEAKLNYLEELREHYMNYWLDVDLQCPEARICHYVSKAQLMVYETKSERMTEMFKKLSRGKESLDKRIIAAQSRLEEFKRVDPDLLAEYRALKDDLECQDMLIQISEGNN